MSHAAFKFTGTGAANYDQYLGPILFEPAALQVMPFLHKPGTTDAVLEIAGGTGRLTRHLLKKFPPPIRLVATDLNPDMLEIAKQQINNDAVEYSPQDAQNLSFADNSFDLVVCQFGLMFFPDKARGVKEAFRVLRPGGQCFFSTWESVEGIPMLDLIFNDVLLPANNDEDPARFLVPFSLYDPTALQTLMQDAGFKNIQYNKINFQSGQTNAEAIVTGLFSKHSIGAGIRQTDPEKFDRIKTEMETKIKQKFGDGTFSFELAAHLVSGMKQQDHR
jgi:ubiquinone/menaquinone biosynthesis C-methylase UbiE